MRSRVFILFSLISLASSAQDLPGYLGKRFLVGYSNYFMLGLRGPGPWNSAGLSEPSPTLNNANCLNAEYVHRKNKMICLSLQYISTGIAYDDGKAFTGPRDFFIGGEDATPYPGSHKYTGDFSVPASLRSFNVSLGLKRFRRGFIPPIGKYRKLEVVLLFEKVRYDYHNFSVMDPADADKFIKSDLGTGEYSYRNVSFACTFGQHRALNDKVILDYGIRLAWGPALNILTLASQRDHVASAEVYFRRAANLRMADEQLVNIHLGIGFLAF